MVYSPSKLCQIAVICCSLPNQNSERAYEMGNCAVQIAFGTNFWTCSQRYLICIITSVNRVPETIQTAHANKQHYQHGAIHFSACPSLDTVSTEYIKSSQDWVICSVGVPGCDGSNCCAFRCILVDLEDILRPAEDGWLVHVFGCDLDDGCVWERPQMKEVGVLLRVRHLYFHSVHPLAFIVQFLREGQEEWLNVFVCWKWASWTSVQRFTFLTTITPSWVMSSVIISRYSFPSPSIILYFISAFSPSSPSLALIRPTVDPISADS